MSLDVREVLLFLAIITKRTTTSSYTRQRKEEEVEEHKVERVFMSWQLISN